MVLNQYPQQSKNEKRLMKIIARSNESCDRCNQGYIENKCLLFARYIDFTVTPKNSCKLIIPKGPAKGAMDKFCPVIKGNKGIIII